jgi:hypothetical protein
VDRCLEGGIGTDAPRSWAAVGVSSSMGAAWTAGAAATGLLPFVA